MSNNTKRFLVILSIAFMLFVAVFLGALLAVNFYEPQIKVLLENRQGWDSSQIIGGGGLIVEGNIAGVEEDLLTIETKPPENPFIEWQKEMTFSITDDTEIVLGEWKDTHEIIEEQNRFFQENPEISQIQYNFLKETIAGIDDLEIGKYALIVPEMDDPDLEHLVADKIIIGKAR